MRILLLVASSEQSPNPETFRSKNRRNQISAINVNDPNRTDIINDKPMIKCLIHDQKIRKLYLMLSMSVDSSLNCFDFISSSPMIFSRRKNSAKKQKQVFRNDFWAGFIHLHNMNRESQIIIIIYSCLDTENPKKKERRIKRESQNLIFL